MKREETRATVTEVLEIEGGVGAVRYRDEHGVEGRVGVLAGGWGDGYPSRWPPRVGDEVIIIIQTVVVMTGRRPIAKGPAPGVLKHEPRGG